MSGKPRDTASSTSPRNSSVPLLQEESDLAHHATEEVATAGSSSATPIASTPTNTSAADKSTSSESSKFSKRRLFGLGKKKDDKSDRRVETATTPIAAPATSTTTPAYVSSPSATVAAMRPISPLWPAHTDAKPLPGSPSGRAAAASASPSRMARSSSPQSTLASSSIFERNVQENTVPTELSNGIPSHIQTEDHIPPVLEASSLAITDQRLDPDDVEIVTHSAHLPASVAVAEGTASAHQSEAQLPLSPDSQHESIYSALSHQEAPADDTASTYGQLDPNDVKRLSFISFADVVQAEHAESSSKDSLHHMPLSATSLTGRTQSPPLGRSPSPMRSPGSSHSQSMSPGITTPPLGSHPTSLKGLELSPARSPVIASSPQQHGELTIETMRQALRRTGSGDLGHSARNGSLPVSAIGADEASFEKSPFK